MMNPRKAFGPIVIFIVVLILSTHGAAATSSVAPPYSAVYQDECIYIGMRTVQTNACCCNDGSLACEHCIGRYEYYDCNGVLDIVVYCGSL